MRRNGLVIARHRRETVIEDEDGATFAALVRGRELKPLTGDRVRFDRQADGTAVLDEILPRQTQLDRIDSRGRAEGVAANVSLILVVVAPEPAPDWQLVDRYLVAAELMGVEAGLVRNKTDLVDAALDERAGAYRALGYALVATDTKARHGIDDLARLLRHHRGVLVGQSGAGKSSLINVMLDTEAQATGGLSTRKALGRHTTTAAMLYRLPAGGELIDSPGVRRYAPVIMDPADLARGFVELGPLTGRCRFANCRHLGEPDCAVVAAVASGEIRAERYASYRAMRATLERV